MDIYRALDISGRLTPELRREIACEFGNRGKKALDVVDQGKVLRYRDFIVVKGKTGDYIVEDGFCTCDDFTFRGNECYHIIAARIARYIGSETRIDSWYSDIPGFFGDKSE
ncbi:SWIM zinc finger family protein [Methanoplanus endosymbiosus]|uniref:SWIM zinc finger family protein n=1 Tax=Methanoplanus endosymbiosus TaxID=33865 RepID=A0A9E7TKN0_9EURY|nr:SWIM zinc finger family protein [Methanoplanus endosymbiosus]UUX92894.1 SWIM zinc finger family protein [Methanoplanus endosymbiosus]